MKQRAYEVVLSVKYPKDGEVVGVDHIYPEPCTIFRGTLSQVEQYMVALPMLADAVGRIAKLHETES